METCLVTGGAGFIGSHLCDLLVGKGYKVICVDNLITGSEKNIEQLKDNPNFEFKKLDIVKDEVNVEKIDYLFHLASPASPIDYQNHPEETALVNSIGTINMLNLAKKSGAKFLLASTSEVYGDPKEHPQKENYWGNVNSFGSRSCYDESKRFAETMTYIYLHKYGIDARIVRIFNTYGSRMQRDDGRVISNFINAAINDKPLEIYGEGNHTRSFCFISDMVDGLEKAMFSEKTKGEVFNLGNPDEYQVINLAQKIITMTNSRSQIVYKPALPDDPKQRQPDIAKAKQLLNWEPKVPLDEGLKLTIDYYESFI